MLPALTSHVTQIFISCEAVCGHPFIIRLRTKHEVSVCFFCAVFPSASCLTSAVRGLQSPGQLVSSKLCLNILWSSKIYSSYALFLLCFSFYSHWLQFHTAVFIFCSRVQRREKCLGCVIVCMVTFRSWVMTRSN